MTPTKLLMGACALTSVAFLAAGCGPAPTAPPEASDQIDQAASAPAAAPQPAASTAPAAAVAVDPDFPQWAFPGALGKSVPGSSKTYSEVQMYDRTAAVDWFPDSHPAMPDPVKGRMPVYACGFCHLPQGAGRSENAALAGLPYKYILQEVADFQSGDRQTPDPKFGAAVNMQTTIKQVPQADVEVAAKYFSSLTYAKHLKLVESDDVPHFSANAFVYVFDKTGPHERLGQRIIEAPDDFERFEMRDPNMTFTAYVPPGSVALGAALAKGDGNARPACQTCHGEGLKGTDIAPPIAGRLPTGLFRQIYSIQIGTRHGPGATLMKPVVAHLSHQDLVDLAAYVASLNP